MAPISKPSERLWRTDLKIGRNIYALLSNDVSKPSEQDQLIATAESSEVAEHAVEVHNAVLTMFGRNYYRKALGIDA